MDESSFHDVRTSVGMFCKYHRLWIALSLMFASAAGSQPMEQEKVLLLDDRSSGDSRARDGAQWRLFTDGVMGGVSQGRLTYDIIDTRPCMRLTGEVRMDNNGGFVQAALDINGDKRFDVSDYTGVLLDVYGNAEQYNMHLRTSKTQRPWQSYRATFQSTPSWQTIRLPFLQFEPYRIEVPLDPADIRRIGIVAIGRAFYADLCLGRLALYR